MATINYQKVNIIYDEIFKIQNEVHLDYKAFSTISLITFYSQILHIYMHKGEHIYILVGVGLGLRYFSIVSNIFRLRNLQPKPNPYGLSWFWLTCWVVAILSRLISKLKLYSINDYILHTIGRNIIVFKN